MTLFSNLLTTQNRGHHCGGHPGARHQEADRLCARQQQDYHWTGHRGRRAGEDRPGACACATWDRGFCIGAVQGVRAKTRRCLWLRLGGVRGARCLMDAWSQTLGPSKVGDAAGTLERCSPQPARGLAIQCTAMETWPLEDIQNAGRRGQNRPHWQHPEDHRHRPSDPVHPSLFCSPFFVLHPAHAGCKLSL